MLKNGVDVARSRVGVMGITFKENCPDIRNSKVVDLIRELENWGVEVTVSDPWAAPEEVRDEYGIELKPINEKDPVDALVVAVGHNQYRSLDLANLKQCCRISNPVLADIKALYPKEQAQAEGFTVFRL